MTRTLATLLALVALTACGTGAPRDAEKLVTASRFTVTPTNYDCSTVTFYLGRSFGESSYIVTDPASGTYGPIDGAGDMITLSTADGVNFSWTSTALIRAVFIRGDLPGTALGDATNQLWLYADPGGGGSYSGAGIYTENSANTKFPARWIDFCFDTAQETPGLVITKTAIPTYKATYGWTITKTTPVARATLSTGQILTVEYTVDLVRGPATKSDFGAHGQITIHNPAAVAANITSISDTLEGMTSGGMDCHATLPVVLAAGADLVCDYWGTLPDEATRTNTATVTTDGPVAGGSATATVDFTGVAPTEEIDDCVSVVDDKNTAFSAQSCNSFSASYLQDVGPYEACGEFQFLNTATETTNDTGQTAASTAVLSITVPCEGCTLTPGYWKTHSSYGPAPYDDNWANIGEDTPFFLSGETWYGQFWIQPAGNAWWNLAHAYAAARLNQLNGATASADLAHARALLEQYTPAQIGALKGNTQPRPDFVATAAALDAYNNGLVGPGHCNE